MDAATGKRVAVIGLGVSGLVTVKNLLERGFDVTGYERNSYIGGLWHYSTDTTQTTVLRSTKTNSSKYFGCFTDFPFPDDAPHYPSAQQVCDYLEAYADHFELRPHLRLNTSTVRIFPTPTADSKSAGDGLGWIVRVVDGLGERDEEFDRVVVCTGPHQKGWIPRIEGKSEFKGEIIHSQAYKGPDSFVGKRVMIVGLGNTASDIAVELLGSASKVYISHRSGAWILKRVVDGKPIDHEYSRRLIGIATALEHYLPYFGQRILGHFLAKDIRRFWGDLDPAWRLLPAPSVSNSPPMVSDNLIPALREGRIISAGGVRRFRDPYIVETADGDFEVDVVIFATGIHYDFSILAPEADPTTHYHSQWSKLPHSNGLPFVRLYHSTFSPAYPKSLAFLEACSGPSLSAFPGSDLISQAIAGFWLSPEVPSKAEMDAWCEKTYQWNVAAARHHRLPWIDTSPTEQEHWLNQMAGNGMNEYLGWVSWKSWKWWWNHRALYGLIMDGVMTPFTSRLFPKQGTNGRPAWDRAEEYIYKANGREWKKAKN